MLASFLVNKALFEVVSALVYSGNSVDVIKLEDCTMNDYKLLHVFGLLLLALTAYAETSGSRYRDKREYEEHSCASSCKVPIPVDYKIEHPDPQCTTATAPFPAAITIEPNSNALRVMERAVNIGPTYRFKATYFGDTLGYFIDEINGVVSNNSCFWFFYIENPDGDIFRSSLGVSNFFIPGSGYSIIWRFETF